MRWATFFFNEDSQHSFKIKSITWVMITPMFVVYRLSMVEFVETLLYPVHLGTCDSKQRRMSTVLNLCITTSIVDFMLKLS